MEDTDTSVQNLNDEKSMSQNSIETETPILDHVIQDQIVEELKQNEPSVGETDSSNKLVDCAEFAVLAETQNPPEEITDHHVESINESHDFILNDHEIKDSSQIEDSSFLSQSVKEECIEPGTSSSLVEPSTPIKSTAKTSARKKPRTSANKSTASCSNQNVNSNIINTINDIASGAASISPPSTQKRRKKDPSAPKAPLNGYLVYFNEERSEMRQKNPNIGFGELTKIIAAKWKELPADEKQKYINEAELDKERYIKEMADYKKSDAYKQYLKENSNSKLNKSNVEEVVQTGVPPAVGDQPNVSWLQNESNVAGFDIPIFTEEFIEHSKAREIELRQLRKEISELDQQNGVLNKHAENLKLTSQKIDIEIESLKNSNALMQKNMDLFRQTVLHCFAQTPLPNTQDYVPTSQNIDDYIMRLFQLVSLNNQCEQAQNLQDSNYIMNRNFVTHVKSVFSKINFTSLFDNV